MLSDVNNLEASINDKISRYGTAVTIGIFMGAAISAGATDEEVKTALSIAANLMRMSTLLNGNEFDLEEFKEMLNELFPAQ